MKPLPYKVRLFNRILLIGFFIFLCTHCVFYFFSSEAPNSYLSTSNYESLPDAPDSPLVPQADLAITGKLPEESPIDSTHILNQKDVYLAKKIDHLLRIYKPDHALFLIVDAQENEILAWGQRSEGTNHTSPTFLSQSTFPAASLFKTVTLTAAFESKKYSLNSPIPLIGRAHSLYRFQIQPPSDYKGNTVELQDAYAKSYNAPMAIVGYDIGSSSIKSAAKKLGFNQPFENNIPEQSSMIIPDTGYGIAEVSSGFTQSTTISPLLAAAQIRALLKQKPLEIPTATNITPYAPTKSKPVFDSLFSESTYYGIKEAMKRTVSHGTAKKNLSSRFIARRYREQLDIGGKTGSLDGSNPEGRYEWFAGFAKSRLESDKGIIIVVMQVHKEIRSQPATQVAGLLINYWAQQYLDLN